MEKTQVFEQGNKKCLCIIIPLQNDNTVLECDIDSKFLEINDILKSRANGLGLAYDKDFIIEQLIELIEEEIFEFYEIYAEENAQYFDGGWRYDLSRIE